VQLPKLCEGCPLAPTAQGYCPPQSVEAHTKLVVWGEAPGKTEGATGYGFTGISGRLLREWLRRAGLSVASAWGDDMPRPGRPEDVAFRNVVCCVRPGNQFPGDEEAKECLRRHGNGSIAYTKTNGSIVPQIEGSGPPLESSQTPSIAYGANATRVLTGYELPILKTRGTILPTTAVNVEPHGLLEKTRWIVASLHPAFLVRGGGKDNPNEEAGKSQDELKPHLGGDARRAIEGADQGPQPPRVSYLSGPGLLPSQPPSSAIVSIDIEGANGRPNIVGVCWDEEVVYVFPWSEAMRVWLEKLFEGDCIPCFHNASFDVDELEEAGVKPPTRYYDTINMAALYDPDQSMNLQTQVLTHVVGSAAWKGLINHEHGPDYVDTKVAEYRRLWTDILTRLGRPVPVTGTDWYAFYNGLDTAWGLALANSFKRKLTAQGRWKYYEDVMMPLQKPLLDIGKRGMPVDEARVARHKVRCQRRVAAATRVLVNAGAAMLAEKANHIAVSICLLERQKEDCKASGTPFANSKELTKLRVKLKASSKGFNPDSSLQRVALLYDWYGLPPVKNKGAKGYTSDDTAVADLSNRLERGTIKPKRGTVKEALLVLKAMSYAKKYATLERTFLNPELR